MSRIVLHIERDFSSVRKMRVLSYFLGDTLKKALADPCFVSLIIDEKEIELRQPTGWGERLSPRDLFVFLEEYRKEPGSTRPDQSVGDGLHHFLFPETFETALAQVAAQDLSEHRLTEICIRGDSSSLPLIVNIPWELATASHLPVGSALRSTLAAMPVTRVIVGTKARLNPASERLRVLYCISEPADQDEVDAYKFHRSIRSALESRSGMLNYEPVINRGFKPTFNELKAGIARTQPHVLLLVCHGQTVKGIPQVCFEDWHPVSELAQALAEISTTFLVGLIACDQTRLEEDPSAHSGAVTLLQNGTLAVVAMQSSVEARLAEQFLGAMLDWLFENGSISKAVAEGRKSMASTPAEADKIVDWSFPALFLTEDSPQQTDKVAQIISAYFPALDEMLRRIPRPDVYLERVEIDNALESFLKKEVAGVREVIGAAHTGKSTAVCTALRRALLEAISLRNTAARSLLYVDFGRYVKPPQTAGELMAILRKQTEEVQASGALTPLFDWTAPRGADGSARTVDTVGQLLAFVDRNRMVLVLDNLEERDERFWNELFERAQNLNQSLIIRIGEAATASPAALKILPFDLARTEDYVKRFAGRHSGVAAEWFEWTDGLPGLLDLLRRADGERDAISMSPTFFTGSLPTAERDLLYALANLPNGVNSELATTFLNTDLRCLLELADRGLLLKESRFGITSSWFRVPTFLRQSLLLDEEGTAAASDYVANAFIDRLRNEEFVNQALVDIANKPGGIDFIQDVHRTVLGVNTDVARAMPLLLHEPLFSSGRWFEAFRMWRRLLDYVPVQETEAQEWLKLAKVAHVLGNNRAAKRSIKIACRRNPATLDQVDALNQRVAIIKDRGQSQLADKITAIYDEIVKLIKDAQNDPSKLEAEAITNRDLDGKLAQTIYNRAHHRRYWLRELPASLSDLTEAGRIFGSLGNRRMKALTDVAWVDFQMDWQSSEKPWAEMFERLVSANETFAAVGGGAGDSAFCYYQTARYYRRRPFSSPEERKEHLSKAVQAYRAASEQAQLAGDTRQREIANGHLVEVSLQLGEMSANDAVERLEHVISVLKTYGGDAWSARVARDMLLLRARLMVDEKEAAYQQAWEAANQSPLHPAHGADARRTAPILAEYLTELERNDQGYEADRLSQLAKDIVEAWLDHDIDPLKRQQWIAEIESYAVS